MISRIKELEKKARALEPGQKERLAVRRKVTEYTEAFLENIYNLKTFEDIPEKGLAIRESPVSDTPVSIEEILEIIKKHVDTPGLNPASGGHLGYIPGGGIYYSSLGDYMADVTNRYSGIFFASPGAVRIENMLIEWMCELIGYPEDAGGNLTSGGSLANLIGIVTAREAYNIQGKDIEKTVIYTSIQMHHCLNKALRIAGLKECLIRYIPLDSGYRIIPEELEMQVTSDLKNGLFPWLIIASAGTVDVGAIDPLNVLSDIADKYKIWLHVDGAYGAFFMLTKEGKEKLQGIGRADSVVMDPHKGLFLPYGSGVILVRDREKLYNAHYYQANYMQDTLISREEPSPADHSPELTKHFRGMRLWLPLKLCGLAPFKAALEEKLLLARYFYEKIKQIEGFEAGIYPELSVVIFRYLPDKKDSDSINQKLVEMIRNDGRIFLSSTILDGNYTIRLAVLAFRTHLDVIDLTLEIIKEKVSILNNQKFVAKKD